MLVQRSRGRPRGIGAVRRFPERWSYYAARVAVPRAGRYGAPRAAFAININLGETDEDVQVPQGTLELEARDQKPAIDGTGTPRPDKDKLN